MEFQQVKKKLQANFKELTKNATHLFEVELDKVALWETYLSSFPAGTNEIYKTKQEFDCSCCRHFIKNIGNAVVIKNNEVKTIWDFEIENTTFQPVFAALSAFVKSHAVSNIWISKFSKIGTDKNFEKVDGKKITEWNHFYLELEDKFVDKTSRSIGDIIGSFRDTRNVFKRSLDEITEDSLLTVLELIQSNSLYKGEEWKSVLTEFLKYKKTYAKLQTESEKDNYTWEQSVKIGGSIGRIKNHSIGTLLIDISEDMELNEAVRRYRKIVDPENYMRNNAVYTERMLTDAKKKIEELGYMNSLPRRYASIEDITVNNILFSNRDSAKKMAGNDVFGEMSKDVPINPKKFSKVEEVTIDNFINNILSTTTELEVFLENRHAVNMVSLIAPENKDSKTMFKWNNEFSWAYSGNITDSSMKENVKSAGGKVDGALRFSIQWNHKAHNDYDSNDLDAHCQEPNGFHIYYGNKKNHASTGELDIDITHPTRNTPAVENITWANRDKMREGTYKFYVNNFANRGGRNGFDAEIEFDGQIFSFEYTKELKQNENVMVAEVTFNKITGFTIKELLPSSTSSRTLWNLKTNQFIPVSVVMYSPNYWDLQEGIGHRHFMFMLKDCVNSESPNGFFNEYLNQELNEHRKVMEALGSKLRVKDTENQLSGVGFSVGKRNDLLVKVKGSTERVIKIKI